MKKQSCAMYLFLLFSLNWNQIDGTYHHLFVKPYMTVSQNRVSKKVQKAAISETGAVFLIISLLNKLSCWVILGLVYSWFMVVWK